MRSRLKMILCAGFLTPVFVVAPVLAVDSTTQTEQATTTQLADQKQQELKARIQQRKDEQKLRLTTLQQKRLQTRCKGAQGKVSSLQGRITGIETSRKQVYDNLVDRLTKLQEKLDQKGANTAELKTQITELQAKVTTFNTDLATYKQTINDLVTMDCAVDPTGFKASLENARMELKKVHDDGLAIKTYVNETIKPTLKKIRADLGGTTEEAPATTNPTTEAN